MIHIPDSMTVKFIPSGIYGVREWSWNPCAAVPESFVREYYDEEAARAYFDSAPLSVATPTIELIAYTILGDDVILDRRTYRGH